MRKLNVTQEIIRYTVVAAIAIVISLIMASFISKREIQKMREGMVTSMQQEIQDYYDNYTGNADYNTGNIEDELKEFDLTEEQMQKIVDMVGKTIEYNVLNDLIGSYATSSEQEMDKLKVDLNSKLDEIFSKTENKQFTETDKETIREIVQRCVYDNISNILTQYGDNGQYNSLTASMSDVSGRVQKNTNSISDLNSQIDEFRSDAQTQNNNINGVKNDINDIRGSVDQVDKKVDDLKNEVTNNVNGSINELKGTMNTQINDLNTAMNTQITNLNSVINNDLSNLNSSINAVNTDLNSVLFVSSYDPTTKTLYLTKGKQTP